MSNTEGIIKLNNYHHLTPSVTNYSKHVSLMSELEREFPSAPVVETLLSLPRLWVRELIDPHKSCNMAK